MHVPAHQATLVRRFAALSTTAPHDPLISMPTSVRIKGLVDNSACEPGKPDRLRTPRDRRLTPTRSPRPCPGGLTTFNRRGANSSATDFVAKRSSETVAERL
jgi:hypothetical protein